VWPFRRKSALPEIDLGEVELRGSQLEITRQYGWQESAPADDPDELRESLERHEHGLPEPEDDLPEIDEVLSVRRGGREVAGGAADGNRKMAVWRRSRLFPRIASRVLPSVLIGRSFPGVMEESPNVVRVLRVSGPAITEPLEKIS
jgi:hypothetical protein